MTEQQQTDDEERAATGGSVAVFAFGQHEVRVSGTREVPMFCAADICAVLGLSAYDATRNHPEEEKGTETFRTPGGDQKMLCVTEPGLYRLIFRSYKPEAEEFRKWVFREVLPALRHTGRFSIPGRAGEALDEDGRVTTFLRVVETLVKLGTPVTKAGTLALRWLPVLRSGWQLPAESDRELGRVLMEMLDGAAWETGGTCVPLWAFGEGNVWRGSAVQLDLLLCAPHCSRAVDFRELLKRRGLSRLLSDAAAAMPHRVSKMKTNSARVWVIRGPAPEPSTPMPMP